MSIAIMQRIKQLEQRVSDQDAALKDLKEKLDGIGTSEKYNRAPRAKRTRIPERGLGAEPV
jgi:uncharacterized coiled-coil protein SlyX